MDTRPTRPRSTPITRRHTFPWSRRSPGWTALRIATAHRSTGRSRPYYLIAELGYASQEVFGAAMQSPEGQAAGADVPNFATGGVTMFIAHD
jgi:uncharacterized protein (TIGR02118 family)